MEKHSVLRTSYLPNPYVLHLCYITSAQAHEDSLGSNVSVTDKDEQHKLKLRNCLVQVKLFATNLYRIAKPTFRNGRWIVIHADYLTVRPFSDCYITIVCPPGIQVEQVVYGEKESDPANLVEAISFEFMHDESVREHNQSKDDQFFQQTKCCFGNTTAITQLDENSDVDDLRGESFVPQNAIPRDETSQNDQQLMATPMTTEKNMQDCMQLAQESVNQSNAVNQFPTSGHQNNGITDAGGLISDAKGLFTDARNEGSDVLFFARRPIGSCNLVLFVHHRLMRGEKSVHDSRIGAKPFVHCET